MSRDEPERTTEFEAQHAAIIARILGWADEAAARRDYSAAVRWVETVRALGNKLPGEYKAKYARWQNAIEIEPRTSGS
jgi:hypothetical protein